MAIYGKFMQSIGYYSILKMKVDLYPKLGKNNEKDIRNLQETSKGKGRKN